MEPLCFLLYVSQATDSLDQETLMKLREKTLLNANLQGITGVLVYRRGFFMQYMEGKEQTVMDLFRHLRGTSRHFDVRVLSKGVLQERLFPDWSVRWVPDDQPGPSSESLIDLFETVLSSKLVTPNEVKAVLRRFSRNSEVVRLNQAHKLHEAVT